MWRDVLLVGVGGAFGAASRHLVGIGAAAVLGDKFPHGTLIVNVVGSFLLAGLLASAAMSGALPRWAVLLVGTGFMGAFTTFSTFSHQTIQLAEGGEIGLSALNVALNIVLCIGAAAAGIAAARSFTA